MLGSCLLGQTGLLPALPPLLAKVVNVEPVSADAALFILQVS